MKVKSSESQKQARIRTGEEIFAKVVRICQENINIPTKKLAEEIYPESGKSSISACDSMISSIKCCLNAFAGKAQYGNAQYALAKGFQVSSYKEEILEEAQKHTQKPIQTLKSNYSYMYRVQKYMK